MLILMFFSRPWVKRILIGILAVILIGTVGVLGFRFYHMHLAQKELDEAIAATDKLDPHWRWDEIVADWKKNDNLKSEENSITYIMKAYELFPKGWPWELDGKPLKTEHAQEEGRVLFEILQLASPAEKLADRLRDRLNEELTALQPSLIEAEKIRECPRGFYPLKFEKNPLETLLPHFQPCRRIAELIGLKACQFAERRQIEPAWDFCELSLKTKDAIHDEPLLISTLGELDIRTNHARLLERLLAQGETGDARLLSVQQELIKLSSATLMKECIRSERASWAIIAELYGRGEIDFGKMAGGPPSSTYEKLYSSLFFAPLSIYGQAKSLELLNGMLAELEKKSPADWLKHLDQVDFEIREIRSWYGHGDIRYTLAVVAVSAVTKAAFAELRLRALENAAIGALGAERYRLANKSWPKTWEDLVPKYLSSAPQDPFRDEPLVLKSETDGLTIYSVGQDRVDNDGVMDRSAPSKKDTDIVFRLWNPESRHQPARASSKESP